MIGLLVQARTGSTRFPRKALADLLERPSLEWILRRLNRIDLHGTVKILLTSDRPGDAPLAELAAACGFAVLRGSERDVLSRFAAAVRFWGLHTVIRVTGDCPLIDPRLIRKALEIFLEERPDYLRLSGVADGFDAEVLSARALLEADARAVLPSEREHVTPFVQRFSRFRRMKIPYGKKDLSRYHLSLDYPEDLDLLRAVLEALGGREDFTYEEVMALLEERADLRERALRHRPEEGYLKSLTEDRRFLPELKAPPLSLKRTEEWFRRVRERIPLASQTYSKSCYLFSRGAAPLFAREARGCILVDADGNRYVDYTMALGACLLGYAFEPVNRAVEEALRRGTVFSLPHLIEGEVAERLVDIFPGAEMVRFGKNGSDVTAAAVRLARAYTGREVVLCCGYHGWQDWYIGVTTRDAGVPGAVKELVRTFPYNDLEALEGLFERYEGKVACVIMEPVILGEPAPGFLEGVKALCERHGALLVFDEVFTGFRFGLSGASGRYGVFPHLLCLGKALGNGMPVSALLGPREIMRLLEDEVFFSFTFGGETASLAAARAVLDYLREHPLPDILWRRGEGFLEAWKKILEEWDLGEWMEVEGVPVRFVLRFRGEKARHLQALFQQEAVRRGELFTGAFFLARPHGEEILRRSLERYHEVIRLVRYALEYDLVEELLEGAPLREIFRLRG